MQQTDQPKDQEGCLRYAADTALLLSIAAPLGPTRNFARRSSTLHYLQRINSLDNTLCYSLFAPSRYNPEFKYSFASCSILVQCLADLTGLRVRFLLRFLLFPAPAHGPLIPFPPSCFSAFSSSKSPELTCAFSIDNHRRSRLYCLSTSALRVKSVVAAAAAASASARPCLSCLLWLLRNQISARFVPL